MAPEPSAQEGLAVLLAADVRKVWPMLDVHDLKGTLPDLSRVLHALVVKYGRMSVTLSARSYARARREAGMSGNAPLRVPPAPNLEQVTKAVQFSAKDLWGPNGTGVLPDPRSETALTNVEGAMTTLTLDMGRDMVIDTVAADPKARAWARVTDSDPCYFCALLATRGAVYHTAESGGFKSHDHCKCHAEPVFSFHYEPTADVRQWQADYKRVTADVKGAEKALAWRRHYEGRTAPKVS